MSHFLFHLFVISFDVCIDILKNLFVKDKMASNIAEATVMLED